MKLKNIDNAIYPNSLIDNGSYVNLLYWNSVYNVNISNYFVERCLSVNNFDDVEEIGFSAIGVVISIHPNQFQKSSRIYYACFEFVYSNFLISPKFPYHIVGMDSDTEQSAQKCCKQIQNGGVRRPESERVLKKDGRAAGFRLSIEYATVRKMLWFRILNDETINWKISIHFRQKT